MKTTCLELWHLWITVLLILCSPSYAGAPLPADSVFTNGKIYRGNVRNPWASALAITGTRFAFVGEDPSDYVGAHTQVYDLQGKTVIPGLIDAHSHPGLVALSNRYHVLDDTSDVDALLASIQKVVADNPDETEIIGGYWPNELFSAAGPDKALLDQIDSRRPLIFFDDWAHTVWANSQALAAAGITASTEDIVPGFSFYQRDETGEPTGWVTESASSKFVNHFQTMTPAVKTTLLEYLNYYREMGVTTVLDAGNFGLDSEVFAEIKSLDEEGVLPVRYHGAYTLFLPQDAPDAVSTLKRLGEEFNSDKIRIDTLKIFLDGVLETRTAAISEEYLDTPGNNGDVLLSKSQIRRLMLELEAEGLNLHVHAVGDRATTLVLDAVEEARAELGTAQSIRIALCHLETVKETDFARFRELGVIANFTPHWWVGEGRGWVTQGIGEDSENMQRAQPLISDGATVTFSSDITDVSEWRADRANPFLGMQIGHTRQEVGATESSVFLPPFSERLKRSDLVNGYTSNAAFQLGRSDEIGSISKGQIADFLILNQDVFGVDKYTIHKTVPSAVIVDGVLVSGALPAE